MDNKDIKKKILIWGSGKFYENRKGWLPADTEIVGFIHGDSKFWGGKFENKPIFSPKEICSLPFDKLYIAVRDYSPYIHQLEALKIPKEKIDILEFDSKTIFPNLATNRMKIFSYYFNIINVGDMLNTFLMDYLFNVNIKLADLQTADLIAVGSLLDLLVNNFKNNFNKNIQFTDKPIHVWGTGFTYKYEEYKKDKFIRPVIIHALRGKLTKEQCSQLLNKNITCVLGDPGLLVSLLFKKPITKKYEIGLIPHHLDYKEPIFEKMLSHYDNCTIIDVKANPFLVLKEIASCKTILSTSLHGLIIADSFGIPNLWCKCSNHVLGNDFKFHDYYSAFEVECDAINLYNDELPKIQSIQSQYKISHDMVIEKQRELLKSFPY